MEGIVKQSVGIDIAKNDFVANIGCCNVERDINHVSSRKFKNTISGFKEFCTWYNKYLDKDLPVIFVMESTGVYHENLTYYLTDKGLPISIVLPKRAKDFSKTLKIKKVTDKIASRYLTVMGLEKKLDLWIKPKKEYLGLKHLTREKNQIQKSIAMLKNQIHAEEHSYQPNKKTIKRFKEHLKLLNRQKKEVLLEMKNVVYANKELKNKVKIITSIPGVGLQTAATIIGETNGFSQIRSRRQLVSYSGLDVINQESGISINTKARISKRGNKHIRKSLHMPALTSIRYNDQNKVLFTRIVSKTSIKMKGVVAVQRKLLVLIYTLWKTEKVYDPLYEQKKRVA